MNDGRSNELPDLQIFSTAVKYCILIICIPVLSFFAAKVLFDGLLGLEPVTSSVYCAIVAVLALHISLGFYIYRAYYEAEAVPPKPVKKD